MNLLHQLLLLSLSAYIDDVTGKSPGRDDIDSSQHRSPRKRTIQRDANNKKNQLTSDKSDDIEYGGGEEEGEGRRDPAPHDPTSHEVNYRITLPLTNTAADDVLNTSSFTNTTDDGVTTSPFYTTWDNDVTNTSLLSTTWDDDIIRTPTRADRVRRGMIRYRELESDWGDAWAHTPTLTTSEENDANGPFKFRPRTMKMPLYNTRNYMKNKAKYAELGILKSIELPESAETEERKLREDFIEEQIRKRGNKPKRHKGLDELIMERVIEQRAAWKNGTWTRSTAEIFEPYSPPPTEPTFLMTINKDLSAIDDPIETTNLIVSTKKQDQEASYETSESKTYDSAAQPEKDKFKILKDKQGLTKLPTNIRKEKALQQRNEWENPEVVDSAQCLHYFNIRDLFRRPLSPIGRLIAHHDLDTGGMTLALTTTHRPTFPTFSRGTYTLPPDLAMHTQVVYHPDPMRSAITALFLRLYQATAPPRGPYNEQFFAPVDFHVPVMSTPKKTHMELLDEIDYNFVHWKPWFSPQRMIHDVFPSDIPLNILYQRIVKYIENIRGVFMSNEAVHAFERLTLGIKRNASIWWQFKPLFHFLPITYYDTVTNYSTNASIDPLVHDFYRAEPTDIRDFTRLERKVIYYYERLKNVTFAPCGMFVHQDFPWLTALPDGSVNHSQSDVMIALVPFMDASGKKMKEYIKRKLHCPIYYPHDTNSRRINDTIRYSSYHSDYKRIHINMVIANKSECDVIFYSEDEILVLRIEQNNTIFHGQYKNKLNEFYMYHLLPEIVDSRAARGLPMRENTYRIRAKEDELKAKQSDNDNRFVGAVWK